MKKATITDVAKKANVSVATVSRVINNQGGVREETEKKITDAIKELNYVRNAVARSMVKKETKTIAVIIPDICNPFFSEVVAGIERKAVDKGYFTMLSSTNESKMIERKIVNNIIERGVDGVIVTTADESGDQLTALFEQNIPVIAVDRLVRNHEVDTVIVGNREGSYEAIQHLITEGHERIAIIRGPQNTTPGLERYKGYLQALEEYDIEVDQSLIWDGNFKEDSGYLATKNFAQLKNPPTAIFSSNNLMSIGALKAMQDFNWELGKDVSFISFDDIEIATFTNPKITTVSRPMRQIGEVAFQLLFDRMHEPTTDKRMRREYILSPYLNVRGSCKKEMTV